MRLFRSILAGVSLGAIALASVRAETPERTFDQTVRPRLKTYCLECHSTARRKGDLDLERFGSLAQVLEETALWHRVLEQLSNREMPPAGKPRPTPVEQAELERALGDLLSHAAKVQSANPATVKAGSPSSARSHWAFQPLREPQIPRSDDPIDGTRVPEDSAAVDAFIRAKLPTRQLAAPAERRTLLRRVTYDLTGLPPSAEEIAAFEQDPAPDAFARVVDRLLASPHYGERWGRHWLDLVRYADTAGETADYPVPVAWRYRNWVIDAFNTDKPYDEFIREQVAGDILARRGPRELYAGRVTATGYLAISRRFGFDSENYHHLTIQDTIDTLGQTVLGLTLGCARCHAHKYDPVSMNDYYALYGIFESTRYSFPGSEQKQRSRALVPLLPPDESRPRWRSFDARVASLVRGLEAQKESAPAAVLRSLDEMDGDFEMQAPAAGGSKGVLVPPWVYEGPIAVTTDAQSPFKHLFPLGKVGASVAAGTNGYRIAQAIHPSRERGTAPNLHLSLDFRVAPSTPAAGGSHRFWIGSRAGSPAVEVGISATAVSLRAADRSEEIRRLTAGEWLNLHLILDLEAGTVAGSIGQPGDVTPIARQRLLRTWDGRIDHVALESQAAANGLPAIAVDNLGVQDQPIAPVSREPTAPLAVAGGFDPASLNRRLQALAGLDGDFELQAEGAAPATPWGPGPNSVVKIRSGSQSPFRNHFPLGALGVHLPNSGAYNGFGQTLSNRWEAAATGRLFASFDFRLAGVDQGGDGSWRFYLGHGPGSSAAIELFFNGREFFRRSGDQRETVTPLRVGEWYQVQLVLNLKERRYTGSIGTPSHRVEFSGEVATGWDGSVDYTFIDSYGHLGGTKPALDADNFVIGEQPLAPMDAPAVEVAESVQRERRAQGAALRQQLAALAAAREQWKQELQALWVDGPTDLAYAVSEGTPGDARIQLRGEPDRPGESVPRGFLEVLGGDRISGPTAGSGRLELAEWLTRPGNPLTARVMVNRIWQHHFDQALVKTPNDFGTRGRPPTHPELLDYLAIRFVRSGWSIKAMHRLILLSATYQQAAAVAGASATGPADPDAFSPFPRRRLSAEELRDTLLQVSGELDATPGHGHPFPSPTAWGYTQHGPFSGLYDHNRRSVYLMTQRIKRHPFLALFDGADPNASTPERRTTTVPTQALYFLNDPFIHRQSDRFAARIQRSAPDEVRRIEAAYRLALGRAPSRSEAAEAAEFLAAYRAELAAAGQDAGQSRVLAALGRVLFASNEFLTVD